MCYGWKLQQQCILAACIVVAGAAFEVLSEGLNFRSSLLQNQVLYKSVLEFQPSNFAFCCLIKEVWTDAADVNQMTTVFLVVHFQHFSSTAAACQLIITYIYPSHDWIIVVAYSGLHSVLVSNPTLDKLSIMGGTHKTKYLSRLSSSWSSLCPCILLHFLIFQFCLLSQWALPILTQYSLSISLLLLAV